MSTTYNLHIYKEISLASTRTKNGLFLHLEDRHKECQWQWQVKQRSVILLLVFVHSEMQLQKASVMPVVSKFINDFFKVI